MFNILHLIVRRKRVRGSVALALVCWAIYNDLEVDSDKPKISADCKGRIILNTD